MKNRIAAVLLCLAASTAGVAGGTLKAVEGFAYAGLDPHKEYYSWHSQKYGLTESLFRLTDDMKVEPWLAKSLEVKGNVATLTLKDGIHFSNGNPVKAAMVKRNMERLGDMNKRFKYLKTFKLEVKDDKTLTITMPKEMPTLKNEMVNPEYCVVDLDATKEPDKNVISTGPFVVDKFIPEGDMTLKRNDKYWGGKVNLDAVKFYSLRDAQSKLMAMQNGEIDTYDNLVATDIELFKSDPKQYKLYAVPSEARTYMFLNPARIPEAVRKAILLVVDRDSIAAFMGGTQAPVYGVFNPKVAYGKASTPRRDVAKAQAILKADGYVLNGKKVYEKNGVAIPPIGLYCYAARNIDSMAVLLKEQLVKFGIPAEVKQVEDPDGTYITDKKFDICFYHMITNKTADPIGFIDGVIKSGSYQDITGYGNAATDKEIETLRYTVDPSKRADLANKIVQKYFDASVFCPLVALNKNIVARNGVSNIAEKNPYYFYGVNANSTTVKK